MNKGKLEKSGMADYIQKNKVQVTDHEYHWGCEEAGESNIYWPVNLMCESLQCKYTPAAFAQFLVGQTALPHDAFRFSFVSM